MKVPLTVYASATGRALIQNLWSMADGSGLNSQAACKQLVWLFQPPSPALPPGRFATSQASLYPRARCKAPTVAPSARKQRQFSQLVDRTRNNKAGS